MIGTNKKDINIEQIKKGLLAVTFKLTPEFDIKRAILDYLTLHERLVNELSSMGLHSLFNEKIEEYLSINCLKNGVVDPEILPQLFIVIIESKGQSESEFSLAFPRQVICCKSSE